MMMREMKKPTSQASGWAFAANEKALLLNANLDILGVDDVCCGTEGRDAVTNPDAGGAGLQSFPRAVRGAGEIAAAEHCHCFARLQSLELAVYRHVLERQLGGEFFVESDANTEPVLADVAHCPRLIRRVRNGY